MKSSAILSQQNKIFCPPLIQRLFDKCNGRYNVYFRNIRVMDRHHDYNYSIYTSLLAEKRDKNKNLKTTKPLEFIDLNMSVHVKHIPEMDQNLGLDLTIGPSPENLT